MPDAKTFKDPYTNKGESETPESGNSWKSKGLIKPMENQWFCDSQNVRCKILQKPLWKQRWKRNTGTWEFLEVQRAYKTNGKTMILRFPKCRMQNPSKNPYGNKGESETPKSGNFWKSKRLIKPIENQWFWNSLFPKCRMQKTFPNPYKNKGESETPQSGNFWKSKGPIKPMGNQWIWDSQNVGC